MRRRGPEPGPTTEAEDEGPDEGQAPDRSGNEAIKNGSLPEIIGKALAALNAEAAYFTSEDGMRTALIFFDMTDSSVIPSAAEPFYMASTRRSRSRR